MPIRDGADRHAVDDPVAPDNTTLPPLAWSPEELDAHRTGKALFAARRKPLTGETARFGLRRFLAVASRRRHVG